MTNLRLFGGNLNAGRYYDVRFFSERDQTGFIEYVPTPGGLYKRQRQGETRSPFLNRAGRGDALTVYLEPRTFLNKHPNAFARKPHSQEEVLALLEPNLALVHQTIAAQKQIKRVRVVQNRHELNSGETQQFFEKLKESLDPFSIDTSMAWEAFSQEIAPPSQHQSRSINPELF